MKTLLIITITFFSFTAKAQYFGVNLDIGKSCVGDTETSENAERKGRLFYALGFIFVKQFGNQNGESILA